MKSTKTDTVFAKVLDQIWDKSVVHDKTQTTYILGQTTSHADMIACTKTIVKTICFREFGHTWLSVSEKISHARSQTRDCYGPNAKHLSQVEKRSQDEAKRCQKSPRTIPKRAKRSPKSSKVAPTWHQNLEKIAWKGSNPHFEESATPSSKPRVVFAKKL